MIRPHAFATSLAALCAAGPLAAQTATDPTPAARADPTLAARTDADPALAARTAADPALAAAQPTANSAHASPIAADPAPAARTAADPTPASRKSPIRPPAADEAAAVQLPPILLYSAARDYRDILDTPAPATVLEADDIAGRAPSTYDDLLGDIPGVNIGGGPRAISQEPNIRGFDDGQVVIRVDGARQTFNAGHRGRFFTDPEALKRVEVLRGGASTLYGSGAMGGVIALETKDADDFLAPDQTFGGRVGGAWSSQGNEFLAHGAVAARWNRFDAMGFLSWRPMGSDLEDGDGASILNSEINTRSAIAKLGFEPNDANRFEASFQAYRDDGATPPNANAASTPSTVVNRELDHRSGRLQWDYAPAGSDLWDLTALAWVTRVELSEDRPADGRSDDTEQTTYGFEAANVSRLNPGLPVTLSYGAEVYQDDYSASRDGAVRLQSPDATMTFAAVFAQGDIELGHGVTLTPGLRYDHYTVDPGGAFDDRSEGQLSPASRSAGGPRPARSSTPPPPSPSAPLRRRSSTPPASTSPCRASASARARPSPATTSSSPARTSSPKRPSSSKSAASGVSTTSPGAATA